MEMRRIALLSEEVASQVAAGEVVERPASALKELVENSLDAGADRIEVISDRGGTELLRVTDNGGGMNREDAELSIQRHATSKIRTGEDLATVSTLGFRGEALPSIASVSRFTLVTREKDADAGTEIRVNGGVIETIREAGAAPGTSVEVRSLFYNLPARKKFLRSEMTEASHIEQTIQVLALGNPGVGFRYIKDGRRVYELPPVEHLLDRLHDLWGGQILEDLVEVVGESEGINVRGFVSRVGVVRANRTYQHIFINGRAADHAAIQQGVREAYHSNLNRGQYPIILLQIRMDPLLLDVNVHPAKREVRFRNPSSVRNAVQDAIRKGLLKNFQPWKKQKSGDVTSPHKDAEQQKKENALASQGTGATDIGKQPHAKKTQTAGSVSKVATGKLSGQSPEELVQMQRALSEIDIGSFLPSTTSTVAPADDEEKIDPAEKPKVEISKNFGGGVAWTEKMDFSPESQAETEDSVKGQNFHPIGPLSKEYYLFEFEGGVTVMSLRASRERIVYEELEKTLQTKAVTSQRLLFTPVVNLSAKDAGWLSQNLDMFDRLGFEIEPFGLHSFRIDAVPDFVELDDPEQVLQQVVEEMQKGGVARLDRELLLRSLSRHVQPENQMLSAEQVEELLQRLLQCDHPYCCPKGKPTMIQISSQELDRKFNRQT